VDREGIEPPTHGFSDTFTPTPIRAHPFPEKYGT